MTLRIRENMRVDIIRDAQIVFSGELTLAGSA